MRFFKWFFKKFYNKDLVIKDKQIVLEKGWKIGDVAFYPSDYQYGRLETYTSKVSNNYDLRYLKEGRRSLWFKTEDQAREAGLRIMKTIKEYHEEIGY
jgi:hypothetical protein